MELIAIQRYDKWLARGMGAAAVLSFVFAYFDWQALVAGTWMLLLFVAGPGLLILRFRIRREQARLAAPSSQPSAEKGVLRIAIVAVCLGLIDVFVSGWPLFSIFVCAAGLLYLGGTLAARGNRPLALLRAKKMLVTLFVGIAAIAATSFDAGQMEPRAAAVVDALRQFKLRHGHYPAKLQELVPEFMTEIPRPRLAAAAGEFRYFPDTQDPGLMWTTMAPFGRTTLRIESGKRGQID
jgi:hypothetical protein